MSDIQTLPNLGKVMSGKIRKLGITTAEEFLERDPYEVFEEMLVKIDPTLCRCALASVVGAHFGIKWNIIMKQAVQEFEQRNPRHRWMKC